MNCPDTAYLLDEIERFLALTKMKPTAFSVKATDGKDRHLVRKLRTGREMKSRTRERTRQFMSEYALAETVAAAAGE